MDKFLPSAVKRKMAELQPQFYVIDGRAVAEKSGLGKHVNMVMQTVFFQLSGVLPIDKAIGLLKKSIEKAYSKKGPEVGVVVVLLVVWLYCTAGWGTVLLLLGGWLVVLLQGSCLCFGLRTRCSCWKVQWMEQRILG